MQCEEAQIRVRAYVAQAVRKATVWPRVSNTILLYVWNAKSEESKKTSTKVEGGSGIEPLVGLGSEDPPPLKLIKQVNLNEYITPINSRNKTSQLFFLLS